MGLKRWLRRDARAGKRISRAVYARQEDRLRVGLVNAQFDLRRAGLSVILLVAGDDRPGVDEVVKLLHEWMDARYLDTRVLGEQDDGGRPPLWKFWNDLAPRGRIGLYVGGWAAEAVRLCLDDELPPAGFERYLQHAARFERQLAADGTLVLKFWLHLPRRELKARVAGLRAGEDHPWQIQASDRAILERWTRWLPLAKRILEATDSAATRWHVIDGTRERSRNVAVASLILRALEKHLRTPRPPRRLPAVRRAAPNVLGGIDLALRFRDEPTYAAALDKQQATLAKLSRAARQRGLSTVLVFEGWDAAGKGGAIRRLTHALDVRNYRIVPVAAPSEEERARHYLWRFWRQLPLPGRFTIFDRSWYGRVLVERVEDLARPDEWQRAFAEIREFEDQLVQHGTVLLKFWLHIDAGEQLERFEAREHTAWKKYRIGADDYRNRARRRDYVQAANDMLAETHREETPWHLVPANDKRYARVAVLKAVNQSLRVALHALD